MSEDELSTLLRRIVKRGRMSHVSIVSDGNVFKAAYRGVDNNDHRHAEHTDIVSALTEALKGRPQAPAARTTKQTVTPTPVPLMKKYEDML